MNRPSSERIGLGTAPGRLVFLDLGSVRLATQSAIERVPFSKPFDFHLSRDWSWVL